MALKECRICLRHEQNCVSLFAKRRGTKLAEIVRFCARVEISEDDGLPGDACERCVDEALNAYLFVNKCRRSDAELRTAQANFKNDHEEDESEVGDQLTYTVVLESGPESVPIQSFEEAQEVTTADINAPDEDAVLDDQQATPITDTVENDSSTNENTALYDVSDHETDIKFQGQQQQEKPCDDGIDDYSETRMKQEHFSVNQLESEDDDKDHQYLVEYLDDNFKDDFTDAIEEAEGLLYEVEALDNLESTNEMQLICCGVRCKVPFSNVAELKEHCNTVHLPFRELECEERPFECNRCYMRFNSKKSLAMHSRKLQYCTTAVKQSSQRICCGCHEEFANEEDLRNHGETVHSIRKTAVDETRPYQCNICYKLFRTFESLRIHQRFVYRPKNFVCSLCNRAFDTRSKLQSHALVHSDKRNFKCDKCSKSFKKEIDLKSHLLLHDEKREECSYCGLKFHRKSNLKMHMRKHQDTFFYACPECPKKFKNNSHLKEHFKVHSKQKPYQCSFCERSFAYCSDRKRHEMTHTGNYPFECVCSKKFARKTTYEKHVAHCPEGSIDDYRD